MKKNYNNNQQHYNKKNSEKRFNRFDNQNNQNKPYNNFNRSNKPYYNNYNNNYNNNFNTYKKQWNYYKKTLAQKLQEAYEKRVKNYKGFYLYKAERNRFNDLQHHRFDLIKKHKKNQFLGKTFFNVLKYNKKPLQGTLKIKNLNNIDIAQPFRKTYKYGLFLEKKFNQKKLYNKVNNKFRKNKIHSNKQYNKHYNQKYHKNKYYNNKYYNKYNNKHNNRKYYNRKAYNLRYYNEASPKVFLEKLKFKNEILQKIKANKFNIKKSKVLANLLQSKYSQYLYPKYKNKSNLKKLQNLIIEKNQGLFYKSILPKSQKFGIYNETIFLFGYPFNYKQKIKAKKMKLNKNIKYVIRNNVKKYYTQKTKNYNNILLFFFKEKQKKLNKKFNNKSYNNRYNNRYNNYKNKYYNKYNNKYHKKYNPFENISQINKKKLLNNEQFFSKTLKYKKINKKTILNNIKLRKKIKSLVLLNRIFKKKQFKINNKFIKKINFKEYTLPIKGSKEKQQEFLQTKKNMKRKTKRLKKRFKLKSRRIKRIYIKETPLLYRCLSQITRLFRLFLLLGCKKNTNKYNLIKAKNIVLARFGQKLKKLNRRRIVFIKNPISNVNYIVNFANHVKKFTKYNKYVQTFPLIRYKPSVKLKLRKLKINKASYFNIGTFFGIKEKLEHILKNKKKRNKNLKWAHNGKLTAGFFEKYNNGLLYNNKENYLQQLKPLLKINNYVKSKNKTYNFMKLLKKKQLFLLNTTKQLILKKISRPRTKYNETLFRPFELRHKKTLISHISKQNLTRKLKKKLYEKLLLKAFLRRHKKYGKNFTKRGVPLRGVSLLFKNLKAKYKNSLAFELLKHNLSEQQNKKIINVNGPIMRYFKFSEYWTKTHLFFRAMVRVRSLKNFLKFERIKTEELQKFVKHHVKSKNLNLPLKNILYPFTKSYLRVTTENRRLWKKKWYQTKKQIKLNSFLRIFRPFKKLKSVQIKKKDLFKIKHQFKTTIVPTFYGKQKTNINLKNNNELNINSTQNYLWYFERQITSLLFKSRYVPSLESAKHLIRYGNVFINNKRQTNPYAQTNLLDVIRILNINAYKKYCYIFNNFKFYLLNKNKPLPIFIERNSRVLTTSIIKIPTITNYLIKHNFINHSHKIVYKNLNLITQLF